MRAKSGMVIVMIVVGIFVLSGTAQAFFSAGEQSGGTAQKIPASALNRAAKLAGTNSITAASENWNPQADTHFGFVIDENSLDIDAGIAFEI